MNSSISIPLPSRLQKKLLWLRSDVVNFFQQQAKKEAEAILGVPTKAERIAKAKKVAK